MELTNYPIDTALEAAEKTIEIDILSKNTGTRFPKAPVKPANNLGQIVEEYADDVGIDPSKKLQFENKRTGAATSVLTVTVSEFGLEDGDVLAIIDDGSVAGDEVFEIYILNKGTGASFPKVPVKPANTLGQILETYAQDIGINPDDRKILFENKRTGASTSDKEETVEGLDLEEGDVLVITDNAGVAGA